jgi:hypothetical protein
MALGLKRTADELEQIYYLSQRTRASAANIVTFSSAVRAIGINAEEAKSALDSVATTMLRNPGTRGIWAGFGINPDSDPTEMIMRAAERFRSMPVFQALNWAEQLGIPAAMMRQMMLPGAVETFRREQQDRINMMRNAGLNMKTLTEFSVEYERASSRLDFQLMLLKYTIMRDLGPAFLYLLNLGRDVMTWFLRFNDDLKGWPATILAVVGSMTALGLALRVFGAGLAGFGLAATGPLGWITLLVGIIGAEILTLTNKWGAFFKFMEEGVHNMSITWDAFKELVQSGVDYVPWNSFFTFMGEGIHNMTETWGAFKEMIDAIDKTLERIGRPGDWIARLFQTPPGRTGQGQIVPLPPPIAPPDTVEPAPGTPGARKISFGGEVGITSVNDRASIGLLAWLMGSLEPVVRIAESQINDLLGPDYHSSAGAGETSAGAGAPGGPGGAGPRGMPGRRGPGGSTRGGITGVPNVGGMTEDERNFLGLVQKYESMGGQNVMNYVGRAQHLDPTAARGYTAQGYYQILNSNWRRLAPRLGILAQNAMAATLEEQTKVALALAREGRGNWLNWNSKLAAAVARGERVNTSNVPIPNAAQSVRGALSSAAKNVLDYGSAFANKTLGGAGFEGKGWVPDASGAYKPRPLGVEGNRGEQRTDVSADHTTNVTVYGATDPNATANAVGKITNRQAANHIRALKTALA